MEINQPLKIKLLSYLLISAAGFSYLVLPWNAGVSVPIFAIIQFLCLYFLTPKKKPLLMFIPIFILALNFFISANEMWRATNILVIVVLYSVMALLMVDDFPIKEASSRFVFKTLENIVKPLIHFAIPVKWCMEAGKEHTKKVVRILIGIAISIPCLMLLLMLLSSADEIFSRNVSGIIDWIANTINPEIFAKIFFGIVVGFYLFGLLYSVYQPRSEKTGETKSRKGDLIIFNILLTSILAVYTIFVVIQFRYLFAGGSSLPYGLSYTYYARRGFFELLFLSGVNIFLILITVWLTKEQTGKWAKVTKILCCYLCVVTVILLVSSFYRMWLYNADDGLTRLRFLVFGFLIFEALGLVFTFVYIIKPKFNIVGIYAVIALTYYLLLNVVPMDRIIARDQIDRYFKTGNGGIDYVVTLSPDAAPEIERLRDCGDSYIVSQVDEYFEYNNDYYSRDGFHWQSWNLSVSRLWKYADD